MLYISRHVLQVLYGVLSLVRVNGLSIVDFFKQVKIEFKRIFWPSRNEVLISVVVVIIMLSISSMFLLAIDQLIGWFMHFLLNIGD